MNNPAFERYHLAQFGEGFFGINVKGELTVRPFRDEREWSLPQLIQSLSRHGLQYPALFHFTDILRTKVEELVAAFQTASADVGYSGGYTAAYPIKVNQQKVVVSTIAAHPQTGLEAGSKPELMAVLALARKDSLIICNGYKDREYLSMACRAQQQGYRLLIMVEKSHELPILFDVADELGVEPDLGIRVRLVSMGSGYWQNTGGPKSKFGLTPSDVLSAVSQLKRRKNALAGLKALHVHLGSQIAHIRDIQAGLREAARYYVSLSQMGAPLEYWDVGGGLGVDYEGTQTRNACSMNYSLAEYAKTVVKVAHEVIAGAGVKAPHLVTESGRAMTAHHALLVVPIVDIEEVMPVPAHLDESELPCQDRHPSVQNLMDDYGKLKQGVLSEIYHNATEKLREIEALFLEGHLDLENRALADRIYQVLCGALLKRLNLRVRADREIWTEIQDRRADKVFCNFSIFQSVPDVWGLEQIFPIVPTQQLHEDPQLSAVLCDLTCDSDGSIDQFSINQSLSPVLPLPAFDPEKPYHLAIGLVGAYQEILGDLHNLFGDTPAVHLAWDPAAPEQYRIVAQYRGQTIFDVLQSVHYERADLPDPLMDHEKWDRTLDSITYLS